jgi:hypothetical protein
MKPSSIFILSFLVAGLNSPSSFAQTKQASAPAEFKLEWEKSGLPIEVKVGRGPDSERHRASENGVLKDMSIVSGFRELVDGKLALSEGENAVLFLLVKNTSGRKLRFSVSPHSTQPGESALGFSFNCLCNGHVYEVGPKEVWYRVMVLSRRKGPAEGPIVLKHTIFEVKNQGQKPQAHSH